MRKGIHLEPFSERFVQSTCEMLSDSDLISLTGMVFPPSIKTVRNWTVVSKAPFGRGSRVVFAIVDEKGNHLGNCGFNYVNFRDGEAEVFIYLDKKNRGKGIGTSALGLLLRYAFDHLRLNRVSARVLLDNEPALRLFEKLGFRKEGVLREAAFRKGSYRDICVFGILRKDFLEIFTENNSP